MSLMIIQTNHKIFKVFVECKFHIIDVYDTFWVYGDPPTFHEQAYLKEILFGISFIK